MYTYIIYVCIFIFIKFSNYSIDEQKEDILFKNTTNITNNSPDKDEYNTNEIENNKLKIKNTKRFIFFKPFSCSRLYFSISNEILLSKNILGFNGYVTNLIHDCINDGIYSVLINQFYLYIGILIGVLTRGLITHVTINVYYLVEIVKLILPKYDFFICQNKNASFFYRINYDFGFRKILIYEESDNNENYANTLINQTNYNSQDECIICLYTFENSNVLIHQFNQVNHVFHTNCINKWYETKKECPLCKQPIFICNNYRRSFFEIYFYFDISTEINAEYYIRNKTKLTPFGRFGTGVGIHGVFKKEECNVFIFPKIFVNIELGINLSNNCEIVFIIKPTYLFNTKDNNNHNKLYQKAFMFDITLSFNFFSNNSDK